MMESVADEGLKESSHWRAFLRNWFLPTTVRRSVRVACVVGPILTIINQPEALLALDFSLRVSLKIALTFLVPYSVSSYSAAQALIQAEARDAAARQLTHEGSTPV